MNFHVMVKGLLNDTVGDLSSKVPVKVISSSIVYYSPYFLSDCQSRHGVLVLLQVVYEVQYHLLPYHSPRVFL